MKYWLGDNKVTNRDVDNAKDILQSKICEDGGFVSLGIKCESCAECPVNIALECMNHIEHEMANREYVSL